VNKRTQQDLQAFARAIVGEDIDPSTLQSEMNAWLSSAQPTRGIRVKCTVEMRQAKEAKNKGGALKFNADGTPMMFPEYKWSAVDGQTADTIGTARALLESRFPVDEYGDEPKSQYTPQTSPQQGYAAPPSAPPAPAPAPAPVAGGLLARYGVK
jgi:hypothetical protein